eukprot:878771-Rhodomonas_salina.1
MVHQSVPNAVGTQKFRERDTRSSSEVQSSTWYLLGRVREKGLHLVGCKIERGRALGCSSSTGVARKVRGA